MTNPQDAAEGAALRMAPQVHHEFREAKEKPLVPEAVEPAWVVTELAKMLAPEYEPSGMEWFPLGHAMEMLGRLQTAEAQRDSYRKALEPFAALADEIVGRKIWVTVEDAVGRHHGVKQIGADLEAARLALSNEGETSRKGQKASLAESAASVPCGPDSPCKSDDALHPLTAKLVEDFAAALRSKLARAEQKYGYSDDWHTNDWQADCQAELLRHVHKGDPLDVAAYAAFCWARGWPTAALTEAHHSDGYECRRLSTGETVTVPLACPVPPLLADPRYGEYLNLRDLVAVAYRHTRSLPEASRVARFIEKNYAEYLATLSELDLRPPATPNLSGGGDGVPVHSLSVQAEPLLSALQHPSERSAEPQDSSATSNPAGDPA